MAAPVSFNLQISGDAPAQYTREEWLKAAVQAFGDAIFDYLLRGVRLYSSVDEGRAAVLNGQQFEVSVGGVSTRYRRETESTQTVIAQYPTISRVADIERKIFEDAVPGYALVIRDANDGVAVGIEQNGRLRAQDFRAEMFDLGAAASFDTLGNFLHAEVTDAAGNVASGYDRNGVFHVAAIQAREINGKPVSELGGGGGVSRHGGRFLTDDAMIITTGQSLGEGSTPAASITTAQEYDSVGFAARLSDYSSAALLPLTVANCGVASRGENPMFGTAGAVKALIQAENGLAPSDLSYRLIGVNTAYSGYKLDQLKKGTPPYADGIAAVTRGKALSDAAGRSFSARAVTWTQGEGDAVAPTPLATYRDALIQLAADYDADLRAVTGQRERVHLICYQTAARNLEIARAQLEAAQLSPLIAMACPMYQFTYGDALHINAASEKWLGGYYGLAYKRLVIDGQAWEPLWPVSAQASGSVIDLTFSKSGLVFDTEAVPPQANYGFRVLNGAGAVQAIASVEIIQPNRVRITLSGGAPAPGWRVSYGHGDMTGRADAFVGGGGNLRDRAGDALTYSGNPMHNWSVLFQWTL